MEKTTTQYVFTYVVIPWIFMNNPEYFLGNFLKGKEDFLDYLTFVWSKIKDDDKFKDNLLDVEEKTAPKLDAFFEKATDSWMLGIITLPEPRMVNDALCIGFAFKDENNMRYFTYNNGLDAEKKQNNFSVCELDKEGNFLTHLTSHDNNIRVFIDSILNMLTVKNDDSGNSNN